MRDERWRVEVGTENATWLATQCRTAMLAREYRPVDVGDGVVEFDRLALGAIRELGEEEDGEGAQGCERSEHAEHSGEADRQSRMERQRVRSRPRGAGAETAKTRGPTVWQPERHPGSLIASRR